ncbi:unnamed protein product [Symbiodinium pilosum]|uniref:Methyltransferase type 11 domain-containing protein n=1 Tax=Symbiodinium pilosum TaxID=2952 RepID=A0A812WUK9_SYMPI|nr:unnamed protein product [Symbiodinium pilosum]
MGFLVSADVARGVAHNAKRMELATRHLPPDVAYGVWVQPLEGIQYKHMVLFEEIPQEELFAALLFPMDWLLWQKLFQVDTCQLGTGRENLWYSEDQIESDQLAAASPKATFVEDCWKGMGGRPEAWYFACCELDWDWCWVEPFTREECCPPPFLHEEVFPGRPRSEDADVVQGFFRFDNAEFYLLTEALRKAGTGEVRGLTRSRCLTPEDCAQEAFVRLYHSFWQAGLLPLRHPWLMKENDRLHGVAWKLQQEADDEQDSKAEAAEAGNESGQQVDRRASAFEEYIVDRRQITHWMQQSASKIAPKSIPGARRCLEWEKPKYSQRFFRDHCDFFDVVIYAQSPDWKITTNDKGKAYYMDIHEAEKLIEAGTFSLVICTQVFEHLREPYKAIEQIFRLLVPGGFVVWSAPLFSQVHGTPQDYFRYTPDGASALAKHAGFDVVSQYAPGDLKCLVGVLLGMISPYWTDEELFNEFEGGFPLQVYLILRRPPNASKNQEPSCLRNHGSFAPDFFEFSLLKAFHWLIKRCAVLHRDWGGAVNMDPMFG